MSKPRHSKAKGPGQARLYDWALLACLVAIGGSSFVLIKTAVATIPPTGVAAVRLWTGALLLYVIMRLAGRRFPPLLVEAPRGRRLHRSWAYMLAVSAIGYVAPFFIFPWAQQYVESGLAGVYMAFMPLWTLGLAYFFADERLTVSKLIGFALGFAGVMVLMGPDILSGAARSSILAQGGLLFATLCYAVSVVISRRTPPIRPRVFACGTVLGAAILSTPQVFLGDLHVATWTATSVGSVLALGVFQTGLAGLIIIIIVKRVGAGFMALANYLTPLLAVIAGAALFHERLGFNVFVALGLILVGVAISQRRPRPAVIGLPQTNI